MAEYKKQHFVPRFYLANFSFNGGAQTNLVRVGEMKAIRCIGVVGQCQADFFYGKNLNMERALSTIEGTSQKVINSILRTGQLPLVGSADDAILKTFVCIQWTRTRQFSRSFDSGFSQMLKARFRNEFKKQGFTEEQLASVEFRRTEGPQESVRQGLDFLPFFADLKAKLVLANGLGEFVSSDNPVVLFNPHYLGRFEGGVTGVALDGTVVIFPLSPEYLLILYDDFCYRVGAPAKSIVPLGSLPDLMALNNYLFLHAEQCIYHRDEAIGKHLVDQFTQVTHLRAGGREIVREIELPDGNKILHSFVDPIAYNPAVSFMKALRTRRNEKGMVAEIPPRNYILSDYFKRYTEEVENKSTPPGFVFYIANLKNTGLTEAQKMGLNDLMEEAYSEDDQSTQ